MTDCEDAMGGEDVIKHVEKVSLDRVVMAVPAFEGCQKLISHTRASVSES